MERLVATNLLSRIGLVAVLVALGLATALRSTGWDRDSVSEV